MRAWRYMFQKICREEPTSPFSYGACHYCWLWDPVNGEWFRSAKKYAASQGWEPTRIVTQSGVHLSHQKK
jgi:hypothetical protein